MIKDTPFDERSLRIMAGELAGAKPWPVTLCRSLLDLMDEQPWDRFTEMRPSVDDDWMTYTKEGAAKLVRPERSLGLRRPGEPWFDGALVNGVNGKGFSTIHEAMGLTEP